MSIRELEPRFRVGHFNIGKKPGRVLGLNEEVTLFRFTDSHRDTYATIGRILEADKVQLILRSSCGDEPSMIFDKREINGSFYCRDKLRWESQ